MKKVILVSLCCLGILICLFYRGCKAKSDQEKLAYTAINDINVNLCRQAVEKLKLQGLIARVAQNAKRSFIRLKAIEKLIPRQRQDLLADIAKSDASKYVRKAAVKNLESQDTLAYFAGNDEDWGIRAAAVRKLNPHKWRKLLTDISGRDKIIYVRITSYGKLGDQKTLTGIAKTEDNVYARRYAVYLLENQETLTWIMTNDKDHKVRQAAKKRLEKLKKKNQALLLYLK